MSQFLELRRSSHEFRTPLNGMLGCADLLHPTLDEGQVHKIARIKAGVCWARHSEDRYNS
ncbi:MAG: histidine kinase dimerization/phospho-acceptor domain-containing protein [Longimicrobiaceae bacterium]